MGNWYSVTIKDLGAFNNKYQANLEHRWVQILGDEDPKTVKSAQPGDYWTQDIKGKVYALKDLEDFE